MKSCETFCTLQLMHSSSRLGHLKYFSLNLWGKRLLPEVCCFRLIKYLCLRALCTGETCEVKELRYFREQPASKVGLLTDKIELD